MADYNRPKSQPDRRQQDFVPTPDFSKIDFSKSAEKSLNPELFDGIAKDMAQAVSNADRNANKSTQLRRFYNEIVLWETRVSQQPKKFSEFLPFIRMINAKAAYAEGRKPRLVDSTFVALMRHTLNEVKDAETMATCKLFWEAFMGFYKLERQD